MFSVEMQPTFLVTGITTATPMVFTTAVDHGLTTGDIVDIFGVVGIEAANRTKQPITVLSGTTFRFTDSLGTADTYTSGGVVAIPAGGAQFAAKNANNRWPGTMTATGQVIRLDRYPHGALPAPDAAVLHRLAAYQEATANPDDVNKEVVHEIYGRVKGGPWILAVTLSEADTHVAGSGFFWFAKDCPAWPEMYIKATGTPSSTNDGTCHLIIPGGGKVL